MNAAPKPTPASEAKLFLRALSGEKTPRPPFWLMRQAGRYLPEYREVRRNAGGFLDLCYTPDFAAEVTLQPLRRYGMDAAILFSDILVVPDALGQKVSFQEGEGPVLDRLEAPSDLGRLSMARFHEHLAPVYETVRRLKSAIPAETALIGFAGAPWTVATYMLEGGTSRDFSRAKTWMFTRPDDFVHLIGILVDATSEYLIRQVEAGAEAIQLFDSWAGVLPEPFFRRHVVEPAREIAARVRRAHPHVKVIGFPRGAGVLYEAYARETGVDGVSLDTTVPVGWAAGRLQPLCAVQGNLDPLVLVAGGAVMREEIGRIRAGLENGPFIFNLGHGIVPETPPENVAELTRLLRS